jgi:hypothetical protein
MNDELKDISDELDNMRQEHNRDKWENLGYIAIGFSLTGLSIGIATSDHSIMGTAICVFVIGLICTAHFRRLKAKRDAGKQMTVGGGRLLRLRLLARWFEWIFGTVLMTAITVIVSLQYLKGYGRMLLLIGLGIFLVATLISQFDQAGWFGRRGGR